MWSLLGAANSTQKPAQVAPTRFNAVVPQHPSVNSGHSSEAHPIRLEITIGSLAADLTTRPDRFAGARQFEFEPNDPLILAHAPLWTLDAI